MDEDERDVDDYQSYFATNLNRCKEDARSYLNGLSHLRSRTDEVAIAELLTARSRFAESFPFCSDELADTSEQSRKQYDELMIAAYLKDAMNGFLEDALSRYVSLLNDVSDETSSRRA
ncbi:hypothetical protein [Caenimonas koreensis]|uniref:Uncharacterized protein n=1 Tax=Caenimonas koreensis DSM 17982 TaxID=1121255 RepID=A0A844B5N8_9BURK|nr:hypothetical protein [Caenimonas koreensis]MRD46969.1 hypothetical protein [Caenimonas koreensis DSM 17982]